MTSKYRPTHPGEFIRADILQELGMTQTQLAKALGVSGHTISQLVNQKRGITLDMASWSSLLNFPQQCLHLRP